jgi:hypothetical protein
MYSLPLFRTNASNEKRSLESGGLPPEIPISELMDSRGFTNSVFPHFPSATSFVFYIQDK